MYANHAVVDFAQTPQPLPRGADGVVTALARSGFVHTADRIFMGVFTRDDALALVSYTCVIPLD